MTTIVMVAILLFGTMAYNKLPVSDLPNVDFPTINVSASLPGASPDTMASAVATVLEGQFSTIAGVDSMISQSSQGSTQITLQFNLSRNIDAAAQDVQAAIARSLRQLPADLPAPPSYQKINPADQPILFVVLTGSSLPMWTLDDYGETLIGQRISMVNGVSQVQVYGAQKYAVRIKADPQALASRGIGIDEVADAINNGNANLPTGTLYGKLNNFTVQANGQLMRAADYAPLIVTYRNGSPVRLREIAQVTDGVENDKIAAWYCTKDIKERAIILAISRQPGENTVEVAGAVKDLLTKFKTQLPASVSLNVLYDRSEPIMTSYADVRGTLLLTLVLVVLVIFVFLRNVSATIIPSLALPMSLVGTFAVMYMQNYNLDNISLMALTLAIGFVVDDAIVMLENIVRHMEMGKPRLQAALDGSKEVGFTIVSMTLSLAAVFIPVLFMGGIVGRVFREFAVTTGVAVLVSGFISLTLTPMLANKLLRPSATAHHGRAYGVTERGFNAMLDFYGRTLSWVLEWRKTTVVFSLIVLVATFFLFAAIPKGFLPSEDRDTININTEAAEGISFPALVEHTHQIADIVRNDPNVAASMARAGARSGPANTGGFMLRLKPRSERKLNADEIVNSLRTKLAAVTGIQAYPQNPPVIQIGARASKSMYQYTLQGPDSDELYRYAGMLLDKMQAIPGLLDVTSDMQFKNPQLEVNIDRDLASSLGITVTQIETALLNAYSTAQVSTILAPNNQYQVILELPPEYQMTPEALSLLYVRSSSGQLVPIESVAKLKQSTGPTTINHSGQLRSVTISFGLKPGTSIGDAVKKITDLTHTVVPPTISTNFQGTAQAFQSSLSGMGMLGILAVVVIYMVLAILYENFWHPITILSALPFAGFGALLTLIIFRQELSIYADIGIIMLVGLVKKNGIMMVDFAIEGRKQGKTAAEAIHEACMIRFRPIMMTTMAALMAGLPIAIGLGAGAEARRPLGLAVVGGLLFSQTLTLYVTPVFYIYMERFQEMIRKRSNTKAVSPVSIPEPE